MSSRARSSSDKRQTPALLVDTTARGDAPKSLRPFCGEYKDAADEGRLYGGAGQARCEITMPRGCALAGGGG